MKILILIFLASGFVMAQIPFIQDTIAYNNRFNNRQYAQYNSQGLLRLTYTSGLGTVSSFNEIYYVEENTDGSFSTTNLTNNLIDDNYSTLSIDQNDKVHIGFESRDPSIFQVMYINNISGTFSAPVAITQGGLNKATPYSKIGPDSVMHFVYYTYVTGADNFYYRSYDLKTNTLGSEIFLSAGEASGDFEATLDIDSNGKVYIAARSGTGLLAGPLKYFNNTSGSFQEYPTGVTGDINYPRIKVDINNKVHIVYRTGNRLFYINNVSGSFSTPVAITPAGQLPSGIQSLEADNQNRLYTSYQSSQAASGKGFYLLFAENYVFADTILIADLPLGYVTRNSSQVVTKENGFMALLYADGALRNDTVVCDIFMKRGNINQIIPVELVSFTASVEDNDVILNWTTATEINNQGFTVERLENSKIAELPIWKTIGFVSGFGTTTEVHHYSFKDESLQPAKYQYRLKQIDFDGTSSYSKIIEAEIYFYPQFALEQNYPNPFNPSTVISWQSPSGSWQTLKVFDALGNEVATLVDEYKPAGSYEVEFNPVSGIRSLSSGIYFYQLRAGSFLETKKMILIK